MADNVTLNSGSGGSVCATDDVSGVHFQKVKLDLGADGASNPAPIGAGTESGVLRVTLPTDGTGQGIAVGKTAVDSPIAANPVTIGGRASSAGNPTDVAAGDVINLRCDLHGCAYVNVHESLPAGTNNIGKIDLDKVAGASVAVSGGTEATSLRVTIASDSTGLLSVDDNGSSLTVDGTVTANAGTNLNTSALALETGGNLAGAATSLAVMDDWDNAASDGASVSGDVAHDTADAGEPVKLGAKASTSISGLTLVADADRTNLFAGVDGVLVTRPHCNLEDIVTGNANNTDGTSTQCIAAGAAGIKHYLTSIILTNTSSSNIYVEIKDNTTVKVTIPLPANGGAIFNPPVPIPGSAATAWNFDPSAAASTVYCSMIGFKSKV